MRAIYSENDAEKYTKRKITKTSDVQISIHWCYESWILQPMCTSCFTLILFRGKSLSVPSIRKSEAIWTIGFADKFLLLLSRLSYWLYRCQVRLCKAELSLNDVFEADGRDPRENNVVNDVPQSRIFWDKLASFEKSGRYAGRQAHKNARNWWMPVKKPSDRTDTS